MKNTLFLRVEIFYCRLQAGEYDHPYDLAVALDLLADDAWDDVDQLYETGLQVSDEFNVSG